MKGTGVIRTEDVVCLCEVVTVSTGDGCWVLLICHIVDEDRVPDIRIHTSTSRENGALHDTVIDEVLLAVSRFTT